MSTAVLPIPCTDLHRAAVNRGAGHGPWARPMGGPIHHVVRKP